MQTIVKIIFFVFFAARCFSQPFSLVNIPQNASSYTVDSKCNIAISGVADGGSLAWQGTSIGTNGLAGTGGSSAQGCANQTGLRLEMSGAGNSSGTDPWTNSITVTINFPIGVIGPVTFNLFDFTEPFYFDGSYYAYYQDKATISATKCDGTAITPSLTTNNGPISSSTSGSSRILKANQNNGACLNEPISIGTSSDWIKQIVIVYSNQDPPDNVPAPAGSPTRYGISQYQYIFISNISATAPTAITASNSCSGNAITLSSSGGGTYSWAGPNGYSSTSQNPIISPAGTAAAGTYTVTVNSNGCTNTATTTVTIGGACTLPVELISFTGKCYAGAQTLEWSTATETNNDFFTIEKSKDGIEFEKLGEMKGAGSSSSLQNYKAEFASEGEYYYYRLKQTDFDGQFSYSNIIHINCFQNYYDGISLFPNPVTDEINIHFESTIDTEIEYTITDVFGRTVKQEAKIQSGNEFAIDTKQLTGGVYFFRLIEKQGIYSFPALRFVKQ